MKLSVDFDMEVFDGAVELDIEKVDPNATELPWMPGVWISEKYLIWSLVKN